MVEPILMASGAMSFPIVA
jgi:hypothetical protein